MIGASALLATGIAGVAFASAASADPGFCGVTASGPDSGGPKGNPTYLVRNQCSKTINVRVYEPNLGRYAYATNSTSHCRKIDALSYGSFWDSVPDPAWYVKSC